MEKHAEKRETEYGIVHSDGQYLSADERRAEALILVVVAACDAQIAALVITVAPDAA